MHYHAHCSSQLSSPTPCPPLTALRELPECLQMPGRLGARPSRPCFGVLPTQSSRGKPGPHRPIRMGKASAKCLVCTTGISEPHVGSFKEEFSKSMKESTRGDTSQSEESGPSIWPRVPGVDACQKWTLPIQPSGDSTRRYLVSYLWFPWITVG